jgi:NAD(P)-dependent dehydrogenase (short-subunit alcohol dehydrogenase family)
MDLRGKRCLITGGAAGLGAAAAHALAARGCAAITLLDLDVAAGEATARALLALCARVLRCSRSALACCADST